MAIVGKGLDCKEKASTVRFVIVEIMVYDSLLEF